MLSGLWMVGSRGVKRMWLVGGYMKKEDEDSSSGSVAGVRLLLLLWLLLVVPEVVMGSTTVSGDEFGVNGEGGRGGYGRW